ncbi:hypothetical protein JV173_04765 [Acholeplasma equirhinis]|uniref:hypothetical protein n=1 Tax=Acholeplasma equirhinis TaxID=555393 RepID=UPI00197AC5C6|nr:hypothetical protein [Acholeplasma equirhinis]MBN3490823.1 hypothetical protein [Acholeplasma equirhinis]
MIKKVWIVVVEGDSEEISLDIILEKIFATGDQIKFIVMNGDVLTNKTPEKRMFEVIVERLKIDKLTLDDVERIIHIIDLDGCFIHEESIIQTTTSKIKYHDNSIECIDKSKLIDQFSIKKQNIIQLFQKIIKYFISFNIGGLNGD